MTNYDIFERFIIHVSIHQQRKKRRFPNQSGKAHVKERDYFFEKKTEQAR